MTERESSVLSRHVVRSPLGRITLAGFIRNGRGIPTRPLRVLGSYAIVYLVDGGGRFRDANGLSLAVEPGDLLLIFPELGHSYGPVGRSHWSELYLVFDGPVFDFGGTPGCSTRRNRCTTWSRSSTGRTASSRSSARPTDPAPGRRWLRSAASRRSWAKRSSRQAGTGRPRRRRRGWRGRARCSKRT